MTTIEIVQAGLIDYAQRLGIPPDSLHVAVDAWPQVRTALVVYFEMTDVPEDAEVFTVMFRAKSIQPPQDFGWKKLFVMRDPGVPAGQLIFGRLLDAQINKKESDDE